MMSAEPQERGFDPAKHLTKVSGRDYLEVKWRLVWFHEDHPDGSIVTEMVQHQGQHAIFKAAVSWPTETGIATRTGWGSEGSDDFGDYLEKAETKAIGRALAAAGCGTQFCDDHQFGADHQRVVDSPVNIRSGRAADIQRRHGGQYAQAAANAQIDAPADAQPPSGHVSEKQEKFIRSLIRELEWTRDDVERFLKMTYGVERISDLPTRQDVSAFIDHLQELKAQNTPVAATVAIGGNA